MTDTKAIVLHVTEILDDRRIRLRFDSQSLTDVIDEPGTYDVTVTRRPGPPTVEKIGAVTRFLIDAACASHVELLGAMGEEADRGK